MFLVISLLHLLLGEGSPLSFELGLETPIEAIPEFTTACHSERFRTELFPAENSSEVVQEGGIFSWNRSGGNPRRTSAVLISAITFGLSSEVLCSSWWKHLVWELAFPLGLSSPLDFGKIQSYKWNLVVRAGSGLIESVPGVSGLRKNVTDLTVREHGGQLSGALRPTQPAFCVSPTHLLFPKRFRCLVCVFMATQGSMEA